jgi:AAA ATPase domain
MREVRSERIHINRDDEINDVSSLVRDQHPNQRVAVVFGEQGIGKSALLGELKRRLRSQMAVAVASISDHFDPRVLLNFLADQLIGQGVDMSLFRDMEKSLANPRPLNVSLQDVRARHAAINISVEAANESLYHSSLLLSHFLADLEEAPGPPRLLLIDDYDDAKAPICTWISELFVPRITIRQKTVCVVAGPVEVEVKNMEHDEMLFLGLRPLEKEHIAQWMSAAGIPPVEGDAALIWRGTGGIPGSIEPFIKNLLRNGR